MIHKLNLLIANVYLVVEQHPIIVDTGAPGSAERIVRALRRLGIEPKEVRLILLTHAHSDHAGSAAELRKLTGAPIAVHRDDLAMLRRGDNGSFVPTDLEARISKPFVDRPFPSTEPDQVLDDAGDLHEWGIGARWMHTPGHSDGSISILFENGDAIIGDILRGGLMGGALLPGIPKYPFYLPALANKTVIHQSVSRVLEIGAQRLYVGHGGPLSRVDVEYWLTQHIR